MKNIKSGTLVILHLIFGLYIFGGFIAYSMLVMDVVITPIFGKHIGPWWQITSVLLLVGIANQIFIAILAIPLALLEEDKIRSQNDGQLPRYWEPVYKPFLKLLWPWPKLYLHFLR